MVCIEFVDDDFFIGVEKEVGCEVYSFGVFIYFDFFVVYEVVLNQQGFFFKLGCVEQ